MSSIDIRNMTRRPAPRFPYAEIGKAALPGWEISLVFVGETRAQSLNKKLRKKNYVPNVLSYEIGVKSGEIVICPAVAKKQAKNYGLTYPQFVAFLFIHGCMHLKGYPHGPTMDQCERSFMRRFIGVSSSHGTTNRNRH